MRSAEEAVQKATEIGYPLVVRPSYVGGRAMEIVYKESELKPICAMRYEVSNDAPVLLDRFLNAAIEVDIDAVSDGKGSGDRRHHAHIEQAGVHSGDSACSLPPYSLPAAVQMRCAKSSKMARELQVVGLIERAVGVPR